jgi:MSHA biogenesis protein MshQ
VRVTAKNVAGSTTVNYAGVFAKANTLSAWNASGGATANPGGGTLSNTAMLATAFTSGVGSSATPKYALSAVTSVPTDVFFRTTDADAITSLQVSGSVEAGLKVASGRIQVPNVYGSERLAMPITTTVQYYNGSTWVTSLTDSVSTYNSALTTATPVAGNILLISPVGLGSPAGSAVAVVSPATAAVASGVRTVTLAAPMVAGRVSFSIGAPIYLPSTSGLATFGVFRSPLIYRRENY